MAREVSFPNGASSAGGTTNLNLGRLYFWESGGDPDLHKKAKELTLRAIELAPQDAAARGNLGLAAFVEAAEMFAAGGELGMIKERTEEVRRLLGEARQLSPDSRTALQGPFPLLGCAER